MHRLIAIVFSAADVALEGIRALHELEAKGSLRIGSVHLIKRDQNGSVTQEYTGDEFPPPSGTLAGLALGSVIGLLGGTAAAAVGAGVGAMIGLLRDLYESESHMDFMAEVAHALIPGKYAVLAEVDEHEATALDVRMSPLGGVVFRATKRTAIREHRAQEITAFRADIAALIAHLAQAQGGTQDKLQRAIDQVWTRLKQMLETAAERSARASDTVQAHLASLRSKAEKEQQDAEAQVEAHVAHLRSDYERRSGS